MEKQPSLIHICNNCYLLKIKCNGETQCLHCSKINITCSYERKTKQKRKRGSYSKRACNNCCKLHIKCNSEIECSGCKKRSINCSYERKINKKGRKKKNINTIDKPKKICVKETLKLVEYSKTLIDTLKYNTNKISELMENENQFVMNNDQIMSLLYF